LVCVEKFGENMLKNVEGRSFRIRVNKFINNGGPQYK
jgi:hypothetical protein